MGKEQRKQQIVRNSHGQGQLVEEVFDDNLLPDAKEIERLYQLDTNILEWLKECAEREQKFRHESFSKKLEIADKAERGIRHISKMGLTFSFIIVLAGMAFSGFLIYLEHIILGSIFGGGILLAIVVAFLKKVNTNERDKE